jgi:hypothetical protein
MRYMIRFTVPRRSGWRAWGIVRADFERALADPADPAIAAAEIASEHRRGANYVRVTVTLAVAAADVADALTIAWDAFTDAAADDLAGWEGAAASAEVQPELSLTGADVRSAGIGLTVASARSPAAWGVHPRLAPGALGSPAVQATEMGASMTAPLIAPLIPPRARPGAREHGRPATARRLPVASAPKSRVSRATWCTGSGGWMSRAGWPIGA